MAVTRASLLIEHPEWANAPTDLVDAKLATAQNLLDSDVLGDLYDYAVVLKTCQLLASSPYARDMKLSLESRDGKITHTLYDGALREILEPAGAAHRVEPQ
jgi:hypothetical protein